MTRGILIARCMLTALGVYVLNYGFRHLNVLGGMRLSGWARGVSLIIVVVSCGYLFFKLSFNNAGWAKRVVGRVEGPAVSQQWIAAGFRLAMVFCGLLILRREAGFIAKAAVFVVVGPQLLVRMIVYRYVDEAFLMSVMEWMRLLADVCRVALGVYLVLGAPHYVRWQMKIAQVANSHVGLSENR